MILSYTLYVCVAYKRGGPPNPLRTFTGRRAVIVVVRRPSTSSSLLLLLLNYWLVCASVYVCVLLSGCGLEAVTRWHDEGRGATPVNYNIYTYNKYIRENTTVETHTPRNAARQKRLLRASKLDTTPRKTRFSPCPCIHFAIMHANKDVIAAASFLPTPKSRRQLCPISV